MKKGSAVFTVAFVIRLVAAIVTEMSDLNPESHADDRVFGFTAEIIANGIAQGQLVFPDVTSTYRLWGLFLAPFWLLPGPSALYARVGTALLGAYAIYNVYLISREYHSHRAGVFAAAPMIVYPSYVAMHSTLLREAFILFAITIVTRIVLLHNGSNRRVSAYAIGGLFLWLATIHRTENIIIYVSAMGSGLISFLYLSGYLSKRAFGLSALLSPIGLYLALPHIREGIDFLAHIRDVRARGRTVMLADIIPTTIVEVVAFSLVGGLYFLYTPFPWMVETVPDFITAIEALISIAFTIMAIFGWRYVFQRYPAPAIALLSGFLVGVTLYGIGTVNYGTAVRHRQLFLWVIFLFGGIGLAERLRVKGVEKFWKPVDANGSVRTRS